MESVFNVWLVPKTLIVFGQRDTLNSYEFNFLIKKNPQKASEQKRHMITSFPQRVNKQPLN